VTIKSWAHHR